PPKDKPVDASVKISSVKVSHPLRRDFTPYQDYLGRLEAIRTVEVRASVSGRLEKIDFKPGAEVKKGDVLFEVDSTAYRLALDKAEADLASAEANRNRSDPQLQRARRLKQNNSIGSEDYDQIGAESRAVTGT